MEDTIESSGIYNSNNFPCTTYWKHKESDYIKPDEPETLPAQYEIDLNDGSIRINVFSRSSLGPVHKRDYYNYLEFPADSRFARALLQLLKGFDNGGEKE